MTIEQFDQLSQKGQMEAIWERGNYIAEYRTEKFLYILYIVDQFYVEEKRNLTWNLWQHYRSLPVLPEWTNNSIVATAQYITAGTNDKSCPTI